jgi:iron-sulfur cluster repair protein YtfE (RIC family)
MTSRTGNREQLTLPRQTHTAEGPHDQTGMYVMHHAFRRDLERFVGAVRRTPLEEREVWQALHSRWALFDETLHHHHGVEDESIWPALLAHAEASGNAEDLRTLADMESEHATIDPGLAEVRDAFTQVLAAPTEDHRNALDVRLSALSEALLAHMRHEETEALPMLQRTMSVEEFAASEKVAQRAYPLRMVPALVPWVLDELPEEGRERMFAMAGPAYRLLAALFRPRYERRDAVAFRYL